MTGASPVSDEEFAALMAPLGPFGPAPRLIAGVSGGPHSLALALLAMRWARVRRGQLRAVICDHGLRPESAVEAAGVASMLAGLGIKSSVAALGVQGGAGVQARARQARLEALLAACDEAGAPWLLLGHHRADQAETVLLRGLSGSGPAGLAAMMPVRARAAALVLRPLLSTTPARLEALLAEAGLVPVRDPSNEDVRFDRVRLRRALEDPDGKGRATEVLAAAAQRFSRRRDKLEELVAERLAACAGLHEWGYAQLDMQALGNDSVARAALGALLRVVGGGAYPPSEASLALMLARGEGTLGGVVLRRSGLLLREAVAIGPPVPARLGAVWDGRFRLEACVPDGFVVAAAGEGARRLPRPAWLPGDVVPTLPALHREGSLAAVPALAYPDPEIAARYRLRFAPLAGAAL